MKKLAFFTALFSVAALASVYAQTGYHIANTFHIKSAGGYDYITVDSLSDNLYVSHGSQVNVLNKTTGDSTSVIKTQRDVHGIALVHDLGKGYISNGSLDSVLVFDLKTNKVLGYVPTGKFADGITYDDFSKKVVVSCGRGKCITIIDPATDKDVATVQLSAWPEAAISDGKGKIYVNNAGKSEINVIDATTYKIIDTWPLAPGEHPSGLAIDRGTMRLFAGCENKVLVVMDANNGKIVTSLPIGNGCDAVGFDVKLKTVYSSNGDGTLTIVKEESPDKFTVAENLPTQKGARTNTVDQFTHKIYLPTADFEPRKPKSFRPAAIPGTFRVLVVTP
jgi:DNA-binding beta-propeller fold protein YncE